MEYSIEKDLETDNFLIMVPERTVENLVPKTNVYIKEKQKRVTMHEFDVLQFFFGYQCLPHVRHSWSSDTDISVFLVA